MNYTKPPLSIVDQISKLDVAKKKVAKEFGLPNPLILESWMQAFSECR
jgi:transposase-like protein